MMDELRQLHGHTVAVMCEVFGVSRSGYYAAKCRPPSARKQEDDRLKLGEVIRVREVIRVKGSKGSNKGQGK